MTSEEMSTDPVGVDSMPLLDDQPIDFSKVTCSIDGVPMVSHVEAQSVYVVWLENYTVMSLG